MKNMRQRFGLLLALAAVAPAWGTDLPQFPFINVTGVATRAVPPDLAQVRLTVRARDPSADAAAEVVAAHTQQVLDLLLVNGVAALDIDAHDLGKTAIFEPAADTPPGTAPRTLRYEVSRALSVTIHKLAAWPTIATKLLGMQNVEDLDVHFDRSDRKTLEAELLAAAAQDAQQRAERLAQGFGQRLGALQAVSQEPFEAISSRFLRAGMNYAYAGAPMLRVEAGRVSATQVLVPETIPLAASVNAIYRLESAQH
jgi:uncharacterized protein YggE